MTTLSDPILVNRGNPERGFRIKFIIAILHMDEGDIMNTLLFLSGTRQVDKIGADLMFEPSG